MNGEPCFSKKKKEVYKWTKYGYTTVNPSSKDSTSRKNTLSGKGKVPGAVVKKEGHASKFLGHRKTHGYCFLENVTALLEAKFTLFIE